METFLAELEGEARANELCVLLPPTEEWTPRDTERARRAIARLPAKKAEFARSLVPLPDEEEENASETSEEEFDIVEKSKPQGSLEDDRRAAEEAGRARIALVLSREHLCHAAERFFAKSDRGNTGEERCEVWGACATVANVMGMRLAQLLAGNGTQYKPDIQDAEDLGRLISTHSRTLSERGVRADGVPIRVAREGCWKTVDERIDSLRKARMRVIQYVAETDAVIDAVRRTLEDAETDPIATCARLDRRKRGRGGKIKLGTGNVEDIDWAYAQTVCPQNEDAKRILAVVHSIRIMTWGYSKTLFPNTKATNDEGILNVLCGLARGSERRREVAVKICEALEREIIARDESWVGERFGGRQGVLRDALERALSSTALPPYFLPVDPPGLVRRLPHAEAPRSLPGKFVATIRRAEAAAPLVPPRVFRMEERVGRSVEDTVGQWKHMPVPIALDGAMAGIFAQFSAKKFAGKIDEAIMEHATGIEKVAPAETYSHVVGDAPPGRPFQAIPENARFETHGQILIEACNPSARALLYGVLKQPSRGGRPRSVRPGEKAPPVVTPFLEELALTFMYWFHMFVETQRGWLAVPRDSDEDEPIHCFVVLSNDLSLSAFRGQPVFERGGACCLTSSADEDEFAFRKTRVRCTAQEAMLLMDSVDETVGALFDGESLCVFHEGELPPCVTGEVLSEEPMPKTWSVERARVSLKGCGALSSFMIRNHVLSSYGVALPDGRPGCMRGHVLEMGTQEAARSVREAIFWTELLRTGGNTEVQRLCRDLDIACPNAMDLVRTACDMSPGWREASNRVNILRKVSSVGGTSHPYDKSLLEQLKGFPKSVAELRSDTACDAWGYRQWQVEGVNIVSIPGFCARRPVVSGRHLWFYSERFDTTGEPPRIVAGIRATSDAVAAARLKSKTRKYLGLFAGANAGGNATADSGVNSFGRHFVPAFTRVLRDDAWSIVPLNYRFSPQDAKCVREAKILGPEFLYDALTYPEYLENPRWPFWRRPRPALAQRDASGETGRNRQLVLASRADTALSSTGLGRRAYDPPSFATDALPHVESPLVTSKQAALTILLQRDAYVRVCVLRGIHKALSGWGGEREAVGNLYVLGPPLEDRGARCTLLDALRRLDDASGESRQHLMHTIARCCMRSEELALAACPPPGGMKAHREWRDAQRRGVAKECAQAVSDRIDATIASPCAESNPQAKFNAEATRPYVNAITDRVDRWMTHAEARVIVTAMAKASCAAVALEDAPVVEKQKCVDLIAAIHGSSWKRPMCITHDHPAVSAFCALRDAVASALYDEPLDEYSDVEYMHGSNGELAARAMPLRERKRGGVRMATREIRQELHRIAACENARERLLFEPAPELLVAASDYVSRGWLQQSGARHEPASAVEIPPFVNTFPSVTPADQGVRPETTVSVSVSGRERGSVTPYVDVYETRQAACADLPMGMRVLLACFEGRSAPAISGKKLRLRLQCKGAHTVTMHSSRDIEGTVDAVGLSIAGAFARAYVFEGRLDALLLFLPPRVAV